MTPCPPGPQGLGSSPVKDSRRTAQSSFGAWSWLQSLALCLVVSLSEIFLTLGGASGDSVK